MFSIRVLCKLYVVLCDSLKMTVILFNLKLPSCCSDTFILVTQFTLKSSDFVHFFPSNICASQMQGAVFQYTCYRTKHAMLRHSALEVSSVL